MRRRAVATHRGRSQLTDENGQPITFATPGEPTPEEHRLCALAVQRATTRGTPDARAASGGGRDPSAPSRTLSGDGRLVNRPPLRPIGLASTPR